MFILLLWWIPPAKCFTHRHGLCTAAQAGSQSSPLLIFQEQEAVHCPPGCVVVHATHKLAGRRACEMAGPFPVPLGGTRYSHGSTSPLCSHCSPAAGWYFRLARGYCMASKGSCQYCPLRAPQAPTANLVNLQHVFMLLLAPAAGSLPSSCSVPATGEDIKQSWWEATKSSRKMNTVLA